MKPTNPPASITSWEDSSENRSFTCDGFGFAHLRIVARNPLHELEKPLLTWIITACVPLCRVWQNRHKNRHTHGVQPSWSAKTATQDLHAPALRGTPRPLGLRGQRLPIGSSITSVSGRRTKPARSQWRQSPSNFTMSSMRSANEIAVDASTTVLLARRPRLALMRHHVELHKTTNWLYAISGALTG